MYLNPTLAHSFEHRRRTWDPVVHSFKQTFLISWWSFQELFELNLKSSQFSPIGVVESHCRDDEKFSFQLKASRFLKQNSQSLAFPFFICCYFHEVPQVNRRGLLNKAWSVTTPWMEFPLLVTAVLLFIQVLHSSSWRKQLELFSLYRLPCRLMLLICFLLLFNVILWLICGQVILYPHWRKKKGWSKALTIL